MGREVKLPSTLLFPVEIVELLAAPAASIKRHDRLIKFKYWNRVPDGVSEENEDPPLVTREFYGHFDSPHEGQLTKWLVKEGDRVNDELTPVFIVEENCDHSVQFGGLCALCGRSLDEKDYMGYSDVDRAPIAMSHDTAGLTVSREEAERIESRTTKQLIASQRLILVVDLDQTVIHASVSPEIGNWIADPESPQHEAVKDVRSFALRERGQQNWYYVKLRPGLAEFLEKIYSKYEMHVYTMATKQYASEVCKVIDPEGKYFADRILSRDASGSMLHKDLKRLFPVSTQMVTIIDDRGDVWNWSPNLIRVVPYSFWSNTGDINSQFLPKRSGLVTPGTLNQSGSEEPDEVAAQDKDNELNSIGDSLAKLHTTFYTEYNKFNAKLPDVGVLLPAMKSQVFDGCVLLFSGFFPLGMTDLDSADIVQWVRSFGAVVVADFLPSVTHVVARNAGTMKARQAVGQKKLVVSIDWVFHCLEEWKRVPEMPFVLKVPNPILPGTEPTAADRMQEREEEMDPNITEGFMRSLRRGDVDWEEMDEELKELLGDDQDNEEQDDENEGKNENETPEEDEVGDENEKEGEENGSKDKDAELTKNDSEIKRIEEPTEDTSQTSLIGDDTIENTLKRKREEEADDVDEFGLDEDWD